MLDDQTVTAPVTLPIALPEGWTVPAMAELARELAIRIYDDETILKKHKLVPQQLQVLMANKLFRDMVKQAAADWNSPKSMPQRLALEAAVMLETVMPVIGARIQNSREGFRDVVEAGKMLAKMAGVGEQKTPQQASEKFTITINLGEDKLVFDKTRPTLEIQSQPEGTGTEPSVLSLSDTSGNV